MNIEKETRLPPSRKNWSSALQQGQFGGTARRMVGALANLAFPPQCPSCNAPSVIGAPQLCDECDKATLEHRLKAYCPTCLNDVGPHEVVDKKCHVCRNQRLRSDGAVRVAVYRERIGHLLRAYKYQRRLQLEPVLGQWLTDVVAQAAWRRRADAIVAVPTHWTHRIGRAVYPAERLARFVAATLDIPMVPLLRRVRGGPHQVGLPYSVRKTNVRGKFAITRGVSIRDARLLLIDDVLTTGATVAECCKVLRRGGAAEIYLALLVKVPWNPVTQGPIPAV